MSNEQTKIEAGNTPESADSSVIAHGQERPQIQADPVAQVDQTKGALPATIDGALEDLVLREPRKYRILAVLRMLAVWTRASQDSAEQIARLREENAGLKAERRANKKHRPLRIAIYLLAPIIAGLGIDQLKSGSYAVGVALLIAAAILLGVALYVSRDTVEDQ